MQTIEMVLPGIGEPESLEARERDLAPLAPGQARIRMEATGVSFAERTMRRGKYYQQPKFPFVPGYDVVGTIEELGPDAPAGLAVGDRVAALTKIGGWARQLVLEAGDLVPVPAAVSAVDAETVIVNGLTACRVLRADPCRRRRHDRRLRGGRRGRLGTGPARGDGRDPGDRHRRTRASRTRLRAARGGADRLPLRGRRRPGSASSPRTG